MMTKDVERAARQLSGAQRRAMLSHEAFRLAMERGAHVEGLVGPSQVLARDIKAWAQAAQQAQRAARGQR